MTDANEIADKCKYLVRHKPDDEVEADVRKHIQVIASIRDRLDTALMTVDQTSGPGVIAAQAIADALAVAAVLEQRINQRWRLQRARREEHEDLERQKQHLQEQEAAINLRATSIGSDEIAQEVLERELQKATEPLQRNWDAEEEKQRKDAAAEGCD